MSYHVEYMINKALQLKPFRLFTKLEGISYIYVFQICIVDNAYKMISNLYSLLHDIFQYNYRDLQNW